MTVKHSQAYVQTPLIESPYLSAINGCNVYLKLENTQPSGSFKLRGLGTLVSQRVNSSPKVHFFTSSGGNAGLAVATAARSYQKPCTVVVPSTTKQAMIRRLEKLGAEVIVHGNQWSEADRYLREELMTSTPDNVDAVYCHPFDDPVVWEGHSTMVDEIASQLNAKPDAVILSVGGGGLYNGVIKGMERNGWLDSVPVIAVETEGAPTLHKSIEAGKNIVLPEIKTVATSLGAAYVTKTTLDNAMNKSQTKSVLVTDKEATSAVYQFADDHKFVIEPACGAALAIGYEDKLKGLVDLKPTSNVVVIVCGGCAVPVDQLASMKP
uniref:L-serine ammonia-lyase n=1 Tax=Blastobotrys adeninivorans TaxID=409370 RepID=A0A060TBG1_BLAAD